MAPKKAERRHERRTSEVHGHPRCGELGTVPCLAAEAHTYEGDARRSSDPRTDC